MSEWLAFNDPFFTDKEPYCNTVRFITKLDAINFVRRTHPERPISDEDALLDFIAVNWAWSVKEPDFAKATLEEQKEQTRQLQIQTRIAMRQRGRS